MCDELARITGLKHGQYECFEFSRVAGQKITSSFVYVASEKMLYRQNVKCKHGIAYRCRDRSLKCPARRIMTADGQFIKLNNSPTHNHEKLSFIENFRKKKTIAITSVFSSLFQFKHIHE